MYELEWWILFIPASVVIWSEFLLYEEMRWRESSQKSWNLKTFFVWGDLVFYQLAFLLFSWNFDIPWAALYTGTVENFFFALCLRDFKLDLDLLINCLCCQHITRQRASKSLAGLSWWVEGLLEATSQEIGHGLVYESF